MTFARLIKLFQVGTLVGAVSFLSGCSVPQVVNDCRDSFNSLGNLFSGLPNSCEECNKKRAELEDGLFKLRKCVNDSCQRLGRHTCEQAPVGPEDVKEVTKLCDKWKEVRAHCRSMGCDTSQWFLPEVCSMVESVPSTGSKEGVGAATLQKLLGNSTTKTTAEGNVSWNSGGSSTATK